MMQQFLYRYIPHPHRPVNINHLHRATHQDINSKIAVSLTRSVGSMWCAYVFCLLALVGLFGLLGLLNPFTFLFATWASQQFAQLVLLPIIMVGQNVLHEKGELEAEQSYQTTDKMYHNMDQIMEHLSAQDTVLVEMREIIKEQKHGTE